ncbi:phospholipid N-methyltransferase PmtA [Bartonella tamiae]|uniref:Ribosomal RNA adenine methylase transferase N-terminal domain-containing protein n=1 Tax=Bartonella tamiae Th239 TaxID=1094558 RepID=J1K0R8_9HYPH|nr:class I SAM-dependent methyltransferase [Bartonella tamiae]EJF91017.1 hypothetical protein ME5_00349 [Bartonella tamiae Th239]EJF93318.1 hypothetical protein MEG_01532 [Bartonella tamiae Th307]
MTQTLKEKISKKFSEEIRFFKGMIDGPKKVGAVLPTSSVTSKRMASVIDVESNLPVLELGPGTGVITKAILERGIAPNDLYSIEYSEDFAELLFEKFPKVNVIHGDAFKLDETLGDKKHLKFDCVICAIPLTLIPVADRIALIEDLLDRIPHGRPVIQITYGAKSPVPANKGSYEVKHYDFVMRNFPPAQLWIYRRKISS